MTATRNCCCIIAWLVCEKLVMYPSGTALLISASMQLHMWLSAPRNQSRGRIEHHLGRPVQREFMHFVERPVHEPREQAVDPQAAARKSAHQAADCRILTERHKRAEIPVVPGLEGLAGQPSPDLLEHVCGLLVRRLSSGRNVAARLSVPGAGRAVADDKDVLVAR